MVRLGSYPLHTSTLLAIGYRKIHDAQVTHRYLVDLLEVLKELP